MRTPTKRLPLDRYAITVTILCCVTWGFQQVAIKAAGTDISPMLQVGLRSGASAILLMLWNFFVSHERWNPKVKLSHALLIGLLFTGEFFFLAQGLVYAPASHMAVLLYTAPLFAAVGLSLKVPRERFSVIQWGGVLTAFSGIVVAFFLPAILSGEATPQSDSAMWLWGDLLGLLAGLSWGFSIIAIRTTTVNYASSSQMLFWQLLVGFCLLTPTAYFTDQWYFKQTTLAWSSLLFQILIVSFISYLAWCGLLRKYLAARLGSLAFLTPVFGVSFGVIFLDETLETAFVIGALLVFLGILTVQRNRLPWQR